jgi:predicted nucleotidyltransferase
VELQKEIVRVCEALNSEGVKYVVVGGCAVILHGYYRTTHDIDLLVDASIENIRRLKKALQEIFKSDEISEIRDVDIDQYAVVRFAPESEEIVIDMIGGAPRAKARGSSTCFVGRNPPKHTLLRSFGASKGTLPAFIHGLKTRGFLRRRVK